MEEEAGGELDGRLVDRARVESCLDAVRGGASTDGVCSVSTGLFCIYGWVIAKAFHSGVIGF